MNIAFLSMGFSKERKEATKITLISLARELKRLGHNVFIITERKVKYHGILPEYEKIENVPVYRRFGIGIFAHARGLKEVQEKEGIRFDVIHNFSNAPILGLRAILAKRYAKNAKLVQTIKAHSGHFLGSYLFSRILNRFDAITVPTRVIAGELARNGCKKEKIKIVHSHIDISRFKPMNKGILKKKYGYNNKKVILYYGAVRKGKGVEYLIRAMPDIRKNFRDAFLIIAGRSIKNITKNDEYEKMIKESGIEDYTKFLGNVNVIDYINLADVVVLPYPHLVATEGNPSCLLESMACKTPVITTDIPELREIVSDRKEVLMAKPKNEKDLAREATELFKNKRLHKSIISRAYKKSKEFDVKKIAKEYEKIYKK